MYNKYEKASDVVNKLLNGLPNFATEEDEFNNSWSNILISIKGCGQNLAAHSQILELKNNDLIVETDHPGYIQLFQLNKKYILEGIRRSFPELEVKTLSFKIKENKKEEKNNLRELTRTELEKEINERTKKAEVQIEQFYNSKSEIDKQNKKKVDKKKNLPPEINKIFENIENLMLTKK